jgi:putative two-component system response regulator
MNYVPKILIVDDAQTNLTLLRKALRQYEIMEACDGRTALKQVQTEPPDLVLLDVMMPGIDGHSVLSIIKNNESTRHIPVMLVTSLDGIEDKLRSYDIGADDFITKPFNILELKARISAQLRIKSLQDELFRIPSTFTAFCMRIEENDPLTAGHGSRTAYYAEQLAKKISHQTSDHQRIRHAALLHDIGYMGVDTTWRHKPSALSEDEYILLRQHPVRGAALCKPWPGMKHILPWIYHHHECFDGSGYPDGLAGSNIPIGARILAIADGFDALTSPRPHRSAYGQQDALKLLQEYAGIQWDPEYVALFCELATTIDLCAEARKAYESPEMR